MVDISNYRGPQTGFTFCSTLVGKCQFFKVSPSLTVKSCQPLSVKPVNCLDTKIQSREPEKCLFLVMYECREYNVQVYFIFGCVWEEKGAASPPPPQVVALRLHLCSRFAEETISSNVAKTTDL